MSLNTKIGTLAAVGAMLVAVPAAAHPGGNPTGHGNSGGTHGQGGSHSHRCQPHNRAYVESGTVDSTTPSTLAQNSDGTWSGTLVVDVTRADRAARADQGQTVTYTFDNAQLNVAFDGGTTGFTAGERVRLIGKVASTPRRCTPPSSPAAPVFRRVVVHPTQSSDSSGSGSSDSSGS
jgi:hypothetical protein